jgi:uncharacterized protein
VHLLKHRYQHLLIKIIHMRTSLLNLATSVSIICLAVLSSCAPGQKKGDYPIEPVPFTAVKFTDHFWAPKIKINQDVTIPIAIEQSTISGRIKNFEIAGGLTKGDKFCSQFPFDDSDIYKIIEAASFSLMSNPDPKLEAILDTLIYKIGKAQEPDGYLYTIRTIQGDDSHEWIGKKWEKENILSHELYNLGHLFEAAAAHYQATGKRTLLDIALKSADLIDSVYGWGKREDYPGHQVVEMGLVKLYRITGEKKYLDLAKFFLDVRGPNGEEYNQAHKKVVDQREAVGHSVRATYMYSGMADIAALYNDDSYLTAIRAIWEDIVYKKIYVTGGIGASGGNEGFSAPYELPNMSAYCETCASVGEVFWNYRMFLKDGDAKYYNILEKVLYNALISGVSLTGDRFFYPNALASAGQYERSKWFGCACCPPNVARILPSLPGYVYAKTDDEVYVNLFVANTAKFDVGGTELSIAQLTEFPKDGRIDIKLDPEKNKSFRLKIRIPGWSEEEAIPGNLYRFEKTLKDKVIITLNGEVISPEKEKGYAVISRKWKKGDVVHLELPMEVRLVDADPRVTQDNEKISVQRGPFVYCAEWPDNYNSQVLNLKFDTNAAFTAEQDTILKGVTVIKTTATAVKRSVDGGFEETPNLPATLIPYYAWANRGGGEMEVWLPLTEKGVKPLPAPTIANKSKISCSLKRVRALFAICDQYEPENSLDSNFPFVHFWPVNDTTVWLQYDFESKATVSSSKVYWFDDSPFGGCRLPVSWELQYKKGNSWVPVEVKSPYTITKDAWDKLEFKPVTTQAMRLQMKLSKEFSAGVHEWSVE